MNNNSFHTIPEENQVDDGTEVKGTTKVPLTPRTKNNQKETTRCRSFSFCNKQKKDRNKTKMPLSLQNNEKTDKIEVTFKCLT